MRRVVVTGLGLVTPLGVGVDFVWDNLIKGNSGIGKIENFDTEDLPVKIAAQIPVSYTHLTLPTNREE